ncbi:HNH endonuclease signature motif containing protein [Neobacillus sp. OS1-33]|uniref:HNH endonuclease signature motif containing protein n=1 Tax=Neobacillus sp. OS1-33 TaxID=3070683 RepID=UPI0027E0D7DB|nr:HNH endonuclease signature motif containing protein [Neobacillus sp. OS1-33]WML25661.1 HNH endonuclease signature motif containing protein [Neobacillus sp. OS1-33]
MNVKQDERNIKADIKRAVRTEAHFGCAVCGNPIIEYHHILPYHKVLCHEIHNLIAVCPTHHYKADRGMISKEQLYGLKKKPFNSVKENIKDDFFLGSYDKLEFKVGALSFIRTPNIFVVDDFPLISITRDESNNAIMNAKFFDNRSNLVAEIQNNEWITYFNEDQVWDIQYSGGKLKVNSKERKIFLELYANPEKNYVELKSNLFYKGHFFNIQPSKLTVGIERPKEPMQIMIMKGGKFTDCGNGIVLSSFAF